MVDGGWTHHLPPKKRGVILKLFHIEITRMGRPSMKNLYPFEDKKGRYLYLIEGKYVAHRKVCQYHAQFTFYDYNEAVEWLSNKWN